jgi:hypothetical protein
MRLGVVVAAAVLATACFLAAGSSPAAAAYAQPDRVTVIGDSVLTAVQWNQQPLSILEQGFANMDLEIAICRTLTGESCPFDGGRPPTLVDLVQGLGGQIGATVVVEVGYNDPEATFADAVNASIQKLLDAGVQRILWVNYHDWLPQYTRMNATLANVAKAYPQVSIVDWQALSLNRYSWFQGDGIHLVHDGAIALATLIHDSIVRALAPPPPPPTFDPLVVDPPRLSAVQVGERFSMRLDVSGGEAPYRWRVTSGPLPRGVHLLANGVLTGKPARAGRIRLALAVKDAAGDSAALRAVLTIKPRTG